MYNTWTFTILAGLILGLTSCNSRHTQADVYLTPKPLYSERDDGTFHFTPETTLAIPDEEQLAVAGNFAALFTNAAGFTPAVHIGGKGDIVFNPDTAMNPEEYELQVTPKHIDIRAAGTRGYFYALQSLRLMLPHAIEENSKSDTEWSVPAMTVKDEPRFGYRGYMLDVSRYFMPKGDLLRMIDCIAMLKINRLHLHLSDDNGWRLEIKKYPKLTEIGAWRVDRPGKSFPERRNPAPGEPTPIGGFYTQEEMKEIIRYAAERQIEIIPEIDIPAHSNAALASYPEYACPTVKDFIGVLPGLGGHNSEIIFCAGNDKTYSFLQDILDEVMEVFPSRYINIGGDEAVKTNWKKCPLCQSRIRRERLKDEEELQGHFMGRIAGYIRNKGREVIGWDELTNSKLPDEAIILGWQGYGQAALKAAEEGHRFIMAPARILYLIRYQGPQWFEPVTYFGNNTLKDVYDYEPVQADWAPEYEQLLMGVQACMWTEFCNSPEDVFYLTFPRLAALAETAWSPKGDKDWAAFLKGLDNYIAHLSAKGIVTANSMYNIQHKVMPTEDGRIEVNLECERPDVEIRYTTDGSTPTPQSPIYEKNLVVDYDITIKAATFGNEGQTGEVLTLPITWNHATAKPLSGVPQTAGIMVNGVRGSLKYSDFEWYTGDLGEPMTFTVDLQQETAVNECTLGCINNYGMGIHKPQSMKVELSTDSCTFTVVGNLCFDDADIFKEGTFTEDLTVAASGQKARYVRFTLETPGNLPPDHVRPGQASKIYIDEIIIR